MIKLYIKSFISKHWDISGNTAIGAIQLSRSAAQRATDAIEISSCCTRLCVLCCSFPYEMMMVVRFSLNMDVVYEKSWPIIDLFSSCTDKSQSISLGKGISISYIIQKSRLNQQDAWEYSDDFLINLIFPRLL